MNETRGELVRYRLDMARATLADPFLLHDADGSHWSVVNRAY